MKLNLLRYGIYVMLLALSACKSCKKEEPSPESKLPPETQTGANTFGCLIDGQPWIPNGGGMFSLIDPITINGAEGRFIVINGNANISDNSQTLSICFRDYNTLGEKPLLFDTPKYPNSLDPNNYGEYVKYFPSPQGATTYSTNSIVGGKVVVTRSDAVALSGTFEFDAIDNVTGKIIKITKGRFDIK